MIRPTSGETGPPCRQGQALLLGSLQRAILSRLNAARKGSSRLNIFPAAEKFSQKKCQKLPSISTQPTKRGAVGTIWLGEGCSNLVHLSCTLKPKPSPPWRSFPTLSCNYTETVAPSSLNKWQLVCSNTPSTANTVIVVSSPCPY